MTIRKSVTVNRFLADAFSLFTEQIGSWWPLKEGFRSGVTAPRKSTWKRDRVAAFMNTDGEEYVVGHVTACEPPRRIVFTWEDPDWEGPTEVEVRFAAQGNATRVDVEHRRWEVGPKATAAGKSYEGGCDFVLGKYLADA